MKHARILLLLYLAGLSPIVGVAEADDEDMFLEQIQPPSEQTMGKGQSALWTLPNVATQYQPSHTTTALQDALQAQQEGRFLDALIRLDEAGKSAPAGSETETEIKLLRASFLLQGDQYAQAIELLAPMQTQTQHAADAYALTAMAYLQQGQLQKALDAALRARDLSGELLPTLVLSYALQGAGHLEQAREVVHSFNTLKNTKTPQSAIALAREAELALTTDHVQAAGALVSRARDMDSTQPYVTAVSGLTYLIGGQTREAKTAFETTLRRDPKDPKALLGLGLAEIKLGNFQAGQKELQAANDADPDNALILTYLGRSQQQSGQTEAALASWHRAQQADPKDPTPWLYQAQAELQANRPLDARESLREAQARTAYRSVYRGERLLQEDQQLLQANLAEVQRRLGLDSLAFQTLNDSVDEKNSASLRNQADVLQGQRFGESARRSLLLQSLFDEKPGNLPSELDIYGDGAGQTGATTPQHGAVSALSAQQSSYNNYDELFSQHAALVADAAAGSENSGGGQLRLGLGGDTLGAGIAMRSYKTDGFTPYANLDNRIGQGVVQWRAGESAQAFVSYQSFTSLHGEIIFPADPIWNGVNYQYQDNSDVTRLGLRYSLGDSAEVRGLVSSQQTRQTGNWEWSSDFLPPPYGTSGNTGTNQSSSTAQSVELQYLRSGIGYAAQWGASSARSPLVYSWGDVTNVAQQIYADWQQALNPYWQLEAGMAWGTNEQRYSGSLASNNTHLQGWLPKLGLAYAPDSATHVRLASWRGMDDAAPGNASLASATLAGIVLRRPGDTYRLVQGVALGADKQLAAAWLLEGQAQRRRTESPYVSSNVQVLTPTRVDDSRLALHWQPGPLQVSLAYDDEQIQNDPVITHSNSLLAQHLRSQQLDLRWLSSARWTANLSWSHNRLAATQQSTDISGSTHVLLDIRQHFNQTDASLNWQFDRADSMDVGIRNATGQSSQYTEIDPLVPRFSTGRLSYVKLKLAW